MSVLIVWVYISKQENPRLPIKIILLNLSPTLIFFQCIRIFDYPVSGSPGVLCGYNDQSIHFNLGGHPVVARVPVQCDLQVLRALIKSAMVMLRPLTKVFLVVQVRVTFSQGRCASLIFLTHKLHVQSRSREDNICTLYAVTVVLFCTHLARLP